MKNSFARLFSLLLVAVAMLISSCSNSTDTTEQEDPIADTSRDADNEKAVREITSSELPANDLPDLPLTRLDGKRFSASTLKGKTVLVLYQPECEDCQREAAQIQRNLPAFSGYTVYFVSNADLSQQRRFAEDYGLISYDNVHFAQTSINDILKTLGPTPAPSVFIYSDRGRLVQVFKGETEIQQILKHL